jgi:hypothetical protein
MIVSLYSARLTLPSLVGWITEQKHQWQVVKGKEKSVLRMMRQWSSFEDGEVRDFDALGLLGPARSLPLREEYLAGAHEHRDAAS